MIVADEGLARRNAVPVVGREPVCDRSQLALLQWTEA